MPHGFSIFPGGFKKEEVGFKNIMGTFGTVPPNSFAWSLIIIINNNNTKMNKHFTVLYIFIKE